MNKTAITKSTLAMLWACCAFLLLFASLTALYLGEKPQRIAAAEFAPDVDGDDFYEADEFYQDGEYNGMDDLGETEYRRYHRHHHHFRESGSESGNEERSPRQQGNGNRTSRSQRFQNPNDIQSLNDDGTEWNAFSEWFTLYAVLNDPSLFLERLLSDETLFHDPDFPLEALIEAILAGTNGNHSGDQQDDNQDGTNSARSDVASITGIEFSTDGINFLPAPETLYVMEGTEVTFRAVPSRSDVPLDESLLSWSGAEMDMNDYTIARQTFNTVSKSISTPTLISVSGNGGSVTVRSVTVGISLYAPGLVSLGADGERVAIMLNDVQQASGNQTYTNGWDCANKCPGPSCDHRVHEPVFGLNYVGTLNYSDTNLTPFTLSLNPPGLKGAVLVDVAGSTGSNPAIRVWSSASARCKGKGNIVSGFQGHTPAELQGSGKTLFYI